MEIDNRNQQTQLPYEKLALLGIDREKADRLPQERSDPSDAGLHNCPKRERDNVAAEIADGA